MGNLQSVPEATAPDAVPSTTPLGGETNSSSIDSASTAAEDISPPAQAATRARRRLIAIVLLSVLLVVTGGYAAYTYRAGLGWQRRAVAAETERDRLAATLSDSRAEQKATEATLSDTQQELQDATALVVDAREQLQVAEDDLAHTEEDVAALEGRTRSLANEKAQVEDERQAAQQEAEALGAVATVAHDIGVELAYCVEGLSSWIDSTPELYASDHVWNSWGTTGDDVAYQCGQAHSDFLDFQARL